MAEEAASSKQSHHTVRYNDKQWPAIPYQPPMEAPTEGELRKPTAYHTLCVFIPVINQSLWVIQADLGEFDSCEFDKIDKANEPKRHDAFMTIIEHLADDEVPNYGYWASEILQHRLADKNDQEEPFNDQSDQSGSSDNELIPITPKPVHHESDKSGKSDNQLIPITPESGQDKPDKSGNFDDELTPITPESVQGEPDKSDKSGNEPISITAEITRKSGEANKSTGYAHIQSHMTDQAKVTKSASKSSSLQKLNQFATEKLKKNEVATEELEKKKGKRKPRAFIPDEFDDDWTPKTKKPRVRANPSKPKKVAPAPTKHAKPYFFIEEDDEYNDIVKQEPKDD